MSDFLQQNWVGILFVVAMLAMHFGGHRHGGQRGHAGHRGMMGGCGGHAVGTSHPSESQTGTAAPERTPAPSSSVPDPTRDAYSPDADEADGPVPPETERVSGGSIQRSRHHHGC